MNYYLDSIGKLYYDSTAPTPPVYVGVNPSTWTAINSYVVNWSIPEDRSGIKDGAYYYISTSPPTNQNDGIWTMHNPFNVKVNTEGENKIYLWLEDNLGNVNHMNYSIGPLKLDSTPPQIQNVEVNNKIENQDIIVSVEAMDQDSGIREVTLFYRKTDDAVYDILAMDFQNNMYKATIPKNKVTPKGISYYLRVKDNSEPSNVIYYGSMEETSIKPKVDSDIKIKIQPLPKIISHSPINEGVPVNFSIKIEFNSKMDKSSTKNAVCIEPFVKGKISWVQNILIFNPEDLLSYDTNYKVTISKTAKDINGLYLKDDFEWEFRTEFELETIEPDKKEKSDPLWLYGLIGIIIIVVIIILVLFLIIHRKSRSKDLSQGEPDAQRAQASQKILEQLQPTIPTETKSIRSTPIAPQPKSIYSQPQTPPPEQFSHIPQQPQVPLQPSPQPIPLQAQSNYYPPPVYTQTLYPVQQQMSRICGHCGATVMDPYSCPFCGGSVYR